MAANPSRIQSRMYRAPAAASAPALPLPVETAPAGAPADPMAAWLDQRHALAQALEQSLRDGFQAVAAFRAHDYLDCVEKQEALCRSLAALDRAMPAADPDPLARRAQVDRLRAMNLDLKQLADVQADLVAHGGRSIRCFQRVWALAAPAYSRPEGK